MEKDWDKYIDTKINRLTILDYYRLNYRLYFICRCECGNTKKFQAFHVLKGNIKSCGCFHKETIKNRAKLLGLSMRKYEEKCIFCGKKEHYAKGYCRNCYTRLSLKGTAEYSKRERLHKKIIPLNKEQIKKALDIIYTRAPILDKNNIIKYDSIGHYKKGRQPRFTTIKRCLDFLKLDIFEVLTIDDKYKDKTIWRY